MKAKLTLVEQKELIEFASQELNISQFAIEKDIFITSALEILTTVNDENFSIIFQGGTCLAKAHQIIHRMSEDCDFKVIFKDPIIEISRSARRRALREFHNKIIDKFRDSELSANIEASKVRNEGQYIHIQLEYPQLYTTAVSMKPYIACEFVLGELKTPYVNKTITSIINQKLNLNIAHPKYDMSCMAVVETAAEKWVGLTRRIATIAHREHYYDKNLVRHLYDLYQINNSDTELKHFPRLAYAISKKDSAQFKGHNEDYYNDPVSQVIFAINELRNNSQWKKNWQDFVESMVFDVQIPSYDDVLENIILMSESVIFPLD